MPKIVLPGLPSAFMTQWVKNRYAERLLSIRGRFRRCAVSIETLTEEPKLMSKLKAPAPAAAGRHRSRSHGIAERHNSGSLPLSRAS